MSYNHYKALRLYIKTCCAGSGRLQALLTAWRTTYTSGCAASVLLSMSCFEGCWSQSLCMHRCIRSVHLRFCTIRCVQAQTLPPCACQAAASFVSRASMLEDALAQRPLGQAQVLVYAQAWGLLLGPDQWDPAVAITFNLSSQVNLTPTFPGDSRIRDDGLHLPSQLTANVSNVYPLKGSWEVTIGGMDGIHLFDAEEFCRPRTHARAPRAIIALRPFLSSDLEAAAVLLVHHITYHMCKNVERHHVYVEPGQASILLQNRQLAHLHRLRHVVFFEWPLRMFGGTAGGDGYGGHPIHIRVQYWQVIWNNHALLAYWGSHAKVALLDIDEFLLGPVFVADKQVACMQHIYMACHSCKTGSTEFAQVWNRSSTSRALAQYRVAGYSEDTGSHAKCWVLADEILSFGVHFPAQGEVEVYRPPIDTAGLMHFTSMWSERQSSWDSKQGLSLDANAYHAGDFHRCLAENFPNSRHISS